MKSVVLLRRECFACNHVYLSGERSVGDIVNTNHAFAKGVSRGGRRNQGGVWSVSRNTDPIRVPIHRDNVEEIIVRSPRLAGRECL